MELLTIVAMREPITPQLAAVFPTRSTVDEWDVLFPSSLSTCKG